jgi:hypothetical protein
MLRKFILNFPDQTDEFQLNLSMDDGIKIMRRTFSTV